MKKYRFFPLYFICFFIMSIILQKCNLVSYGKPIGGHTWDQIYRKLPYLIGCSCVLALVINQTMNNIVRKDLKDIVNAKKRILEKEIFQSMTNKLNCRVCGYDNDDFPWGEDGKNPTYQICPCCGVEFGVDDITPENIQKFRNGWQKSNYKWFDRQMKPSDWSLEKQMKNIPKIGNSVENVE